MAIKMPKPQINYAYQGIVKNGEPRVLAVDTTEKKLKSRFPKVKEALKKLEGENAKNVRIIIVKMTTTYEFVREVPNKIKVDKEEPEKANA